MTMSPFFTVHQDLPREGPGEPADVAWAVSLAQTPAGARICDAACGPGADIPHLLAAVPDAQVTGVDKMAHFVAAAQDHAGPQVQVVQGEMGDLTGPYDLIWCAGALYFLGVTDGLTQWRAALAPGGAVAFSEPCWFTDDRSAPDDFWEGYDTGTEAEIAQRIDAAGYDLLGTRRLSDAAWEAYYTPMDARVAKLRQEERPELTQALDEAEREAALWRAHRRDTGYLLCVVRPR